MSAWNQTVVCFLPEVGYTLFGRQVCGVHIYLTTVDCHLRGSGRSAECPHSDDDDDDPTRSDSR
jgi:hypothetical protein